MSGKAVGERFGRLTVSAIVSPGGRLVRVSCDCGNEKVVRSGDLRAGTQKSCGCLQGNPTHGETRGEGHGNKSTEYRTWVGIVARCTNPNHRAYKYYGARGITVCDRWLKSFANFLADMRRKPDPTLTLERIDNNLGYGPENCRWATRAEQQHNRRDNIFIEHDGLRLTVTEWSRRLGYCVRSRIRHGWDHERAVSVPVQQRRKSA